MNTGRCEVSAILIIDDLEYDKVNQEINTLPWFLVA